MSSAESADWGMNDVAEELVRKSVEGEAGAPPETLSAPTRKTAMMLSSLVFHFDGTPEELAENDFYRLLMSRLETYAVQDAKQSGSVSQMRAIAGQKSQDSVDAGSLEWVQFVKDLYQPDDRHHHLYMAITSPPPPDITGVGKSYTAYSIIETLQMISDIDFATNNSTDPFTTVTNWGELMWWLKNHPGQKLFLWDEAAQTLLYDDQVSGKELAQLIRLLRKHNAHLLLVGHTGRGITKDVRRMIMFLQKQSQKEAVYGRGLKEVTHGDHMEVSEVLERVENIPPTNIDYESTDDEGEFDIEMQEQRRPVDYTEASSSSEEWKRCRVCDRTVGIDETGFCPSHDASDLDDFEDDLGHEHDTHTDEQVRAHYHEVRGLDGAINWLFSE